MKSEIQINNTAGACQIDIEGTIGVPEEWQFDEPGSRCWPNLSGASTAAARA